MSESKVSVEDACKMSLDEYIKANPVVVVLRKKSRKYRSQHSVNSERDIEMLVDQSNGYDESTSNALSQQFRLKYPNRPAKFYRRRYFNSNQRRRNRDLYGIHRNNQPNFKPQNLRSHTTTPPGVPMGTTLTGTLTQHPQKVHEQKYDMEIQKLISEIQGKTLYVTCDSGSQSVISFDGPGIDDCQFKVSTTSITLNQRFS